MNAGQARHRSRDSEGGGGITAAAPSIAVITSEANNPWRRMRRYGLLRRVRSSQMTAEARLAARQKSDSVNPPICSRRSSPRAKIFIFRFSEKYDFLPASRPIRGDVRTSRTLRWDAVDADNGERRTPEFADGEVAWSRRPDAGVKLPSCLGSEGGKKARSPGRARSKP